MGFHDTIITVSRQFHRRLLYHGNAMKGHSAMAVPRYRHEGARLYRDTAMERQVMWVLALMLPLRGSNTSHFKHRCLFFYILRQYHGLSMNHSGSLIGLYGIAMILSPAMAVSHRAVAVPRPVTRLSF